MLASAGGWWEAATPLDPGDDYAFSLDGAPPLPDPRSRWQPNGVHAASRWFDPGAFRWTDDAWQPPSWPQAVVYELHVGTFSVEGTFAGVERHLDHLVALGVTHIELMPVAEFPGTRGWGYDGVALFAPHHAYGGPAALQHLVNACHQRGLAVLLDVVYNHLGPDGNYLARFGPYFTHDYATPWGDALNFSGPSSDEVRQFFIDNACYWLRDFHFDGLRLDAVHAIVDPSARTFLEDLGAAAANLQKELGRDLVLVAESDANDPRLSASIAAGGCGLTAQWDEDFHHALHASLSGEHSGYYADFGSLAALAATFERVFWLDGRYSGYRRRRHGRPVVTRDGGRFVAYSQNHDQTGNRPQGERLAALLSPGLLRVAAALVLLSPYIPLMFQGEEWAASTPFLYFTDHTDPALADAIRHGRPPESPDPQAPDTFARSCLRWDELDLPAHRDMLLWYQKLLSTRRKLPGLASHDLASIRVAFDEQQRWFRLERGPNVCLVCNLALSPQAVPLPAGRWRTEFASAAPVTMAADSALLPPESAALLRLD